MSNLAPLNIFYESFGIVYACKTLLTVALTRKLNTKLILNQGNIRLALCVAGMRSSYHHLKKKIGCRAAAVFASIWILADNNENRRISVALNLFVKAALFGVRSFIYKGNRDELHEHKKDRELNVFKSNWINYLAKLIHKFGDLIQWHLIAFHVTLTAFNYPFVLPKSYYVIKVTKY
jgi:hypothetical protein